MLRKILSFAIACSILSGMSIIGCVYATTENILENGGFESGDTSPWEYWTHPSTNPQLQILTDAESVHSGEYGAKSHGSLSCYVTSFEENTYYIFRSFIKVLDDNNLVCFTLRDETKNLYYMDYSSTFATGDWVETVKVLKTSEEISEKLKFSTAVYNNIDWTTLGYYVDDMEITKLNLSASISGNDEVEYNEEGGSSIYRVPAVLNNYGTSDAISGYNVLWSLKNGQPAGISIDPDTGVLGVSGECEDGASVTVVADITANVSVCTNQANSYSNHDVNLQCEKTVVLKKTEMPTKPDEPEEPTEANTENLLGNEDFESGTLSPWTVGGEASISEKSYSGKYSVYSKKGLEVCQTLDVKPNTYYIAYSNLCAENNKTLLYMNIWDDNMYNQNNGNYGNWLLDHYVTGNADNWNTLVKIVKTSPDTTAVRYQVNAYNSSWSEGYPFWADNMYFGELGLKLNVEGEKEVMLTTSDSVNFKYAVDVTDSAGSKKLFKEEPVVSWSLDGEYPGITIDNNGNLELTNEAQLGDVKIVCEASATLSDAASSNYKTVYGVDEFSVDVTKKEIYEIKVIPVAPVLKDVAIASYKDGENVRLVPSYIYTQSEGVEESGTTYTWYQSDNETEGYAEISNAEELTVSPNQYKYIRLEITPKDADGNIGKLYKTNPVLCTTFFDESPVITNVQIKAYDKIAVGSKLYVGYSEEDSEDILTDVIWYKSSDDTVYTKMATTKDYTLSKDDVNAYLKAEITPYFKKGDAKIMGEKITTDYIKGVAIPKIENLSIKGNAIIGDTVYADYLYVNANGIGEGNSIYEWKLDGNVVSSEGSYKISEQGGILTLTVIPVSDDGISGEKYTATRIISPLSYSSNMEVGGGSYGSVVRNEVPAPIETSNTEEDDATLNFKDTKGHWAKLSIDKLFEKHIVTGNEDKLFEPDKKITRAEAVAMVIRALGVYESDYKEGTFNDVKKDDWFANYFMTAYDCGVINGDNENNANPNAEIKREELAAIIVRAVEFKKQASISIGDVLGFSDSESISTWFVEDVNKAYSLGLINGMPDGTFAPLSNATKAQCATIIERLLENI